MKEISMTVLHARTAITTRALQREIVGQMNELSVDGLLALRDFAASLRQRTLFREPHISPALLRHSTVEMPADSLLGLMNLLPPVGGDALADSESLYDQV
jgi:hypothetical protein